MLFMLIDKGYQLDEVVFYDTGMEFQAIYNTRDAVLPILKKLGIKYTELHPEQPFLWTMFERPVKKRGTNIIHKKVQNLNNQVFHISSFLKRLKLYSETFFRDVPKRL